MFPNCEYTEFKKKKKNHTSELVVLVQSSHVHLLRGSKFLKTKLDTQPVFLMGTLWNSSIRLKGKKNITINGTILTNYKTIQIIIIKISFCECLWSVITPLKFQRKLNLCKQWWKTVSLRSLWSWNVKAIKKQKHKT